MSLLAFMAAHAFTGLHHERPHTRRPTLTPPQMKELREAHEGAPEAQHSFWKVLLLFHPPKRDLKLMLI